MSNAYGVLQHHHILISILHEIIRHKMLNIPGTCGISSLIIGRGAYSGSIGGVGGSEKPVPNRKGAGRGGADKGGGSDSTGNG